MKETKILTEICNKLGVEIYYDHKIRIKSGDVLTAYAFMPHFGSYKGMCIFLEAKDVGCSLQELGDTGYGYSVVDLSEESLQKEVPLDLAGFQDLFSDWGWTGDPAKRPTWCKN